MDDYDNFDPVADAAATGSAVPKKKSTKAKKAEEPMPDVNPQLKFTSLPAPISMLNAKNVAGNFSRADKQAWWATGRKTEAEFDSERAEKRRRLSAREDGDMNVDSATPAEEEWDGNPASRTLVIHPGSRWLRIGRATDDLPVGVPNVIARRSTTLLHRGHSHAPIPAALDPTLDPKIEALRGDLRNRFRAYKLRPQTDGTAQAKVYNTTAETTEVVEDPATERLAWTATEALPPKACLIGEAALRISEPEKEGWTLRWPIERGDFNTAAYGSMSELLGDIAEIWLHVIVKIMGIPGRALRDYSVVFVIPDLYTDAYMREMAELLLQTVGFKQLCFQQESMCGSLGTGLSTCCIIDMGARKTSIACVEEGMILPETRACLDIGGDDITELLFQLLMRIDFPYREADINRKYDWVLYEYLKESVCVLSEGDVALNLYHFDVRRPGRPLLKSSVRLFDEVILAPMCLFGPRIVDFDRKHLPMPVLRPAAADIDDIIELGGNAVTQTMRICTRHLLPSHPDGPNAGDLDPRTQVIPPATPQTAGAPPDQQQQQHQLDIARESSKVPLDVVVFEAICTVLAEDRMKKLVNSVVLVGGTAKIHNAGFALQSRLAVLFSTRYPSLTSQLNIVPPPLGFDPRIVVWKGATLLAKLDAVNDLWIRADDWDRMGMRAVKERTLCCL